MKTLLGFVAVFTLLATQVLANEDSFILETTLGGGEVQWECESIRAFSPEGKAVDIKIGNILAIASFPATLLHGQTVGNLQHLYVLYKIWLDDEQIAFASQITGGQDNQAKCLFKPKEGTALDNPPTWYPLGGPQKSDAAYLRQLKRPGFSKSISFSELDIIRPAIQSCMESQAKGWEASRLEASNAEARRADCLKEARDQCRCDRMASVFCDQCLEGKCPRPVIRNENNPNGQQCDWLRFGEAQ